MDTKMYIFSLDYGNRMNEKEFIKSLLRRFDKDTLVGCGVFVNNNPYNLEFLFFVSIVDQIEEFEKFLKEYPNKKSRVFNYFLNHILESFCKKGYNGVTFIDENDVEEIITEDANGIFLFPCEKVLNQHWGGGVEMKKRFKVFLSHSNRDKEKVDMIFDEFQKSEISVWYDKYEIEPGDSITEKISKGLDESDIGIICISNNFLNASSGWTTSELNFFIQRRMRHTDKYFIIVNFDVPHDKLPSLVQDYKYIDFKQKDAIVTLINTIKKRMNCKK